MKKLLLSFLLVLLSSSFVHAASDPESLYTKVYQMYIAENADCSDPILVMDSETLLGDALEPLDMLTGPTFGSASVADGTYNCVIFKMSDQLTFTPSENDGSCVAGEEEAIDVCSSYGEDSPAAYVTDPLTGEDTQCAEASGTEDVVYLYLSTNSASEGGGDGTNAFQPPTSSADAEHGILLSSPLVVSGDAEVEFVVDGSGKVEDNFGECDMQPPAFGFR